MCACSKMDIAYDWAPRLAANYLDDHFDFTSSRFDDVKKALTNDLKKNKNLIKSEALNSLETLLQAADQKELSELQLRSFIEQLRSSQVLLIESFKNSISEVVLNMNQQELSQLKKVTSKRWIKSEETMNDPVEYKKKSLKRFNESMESLFDDSTQEQQELFKVLNEKNLNYAKQQIKSRHNNLLKIEQLFDQKTELLAFVLKFYSNDKSLKTDQQKIQDDLVLGESLKFIQEIWLSLTVEQKKYFKKTITGYKLQIQEL